MPLLASLQAQSQPLEGRLRLPLLPGTGQCRGGSFFHPALQPTALSLAKSRLPSEWQGMELPREGNMQLSWLKAAEVHIREVFPLVTMLHVWRGPFPG